MLRRARKHYTRAESSPNDVFRLSVPARPAFVRVVAVAASSLAARRNFSPVAAQMLSTAAEGAAECLIGASRRPGRLFVNYEIRDSELHVILERRGRLGRVKIRSAQLQCFRARVGRQLDSWGVDRNRLWLVKIRA